MPLLPRIRNPIRFRLAGGGRRSAYGFEATILADLCDVILDARKSKQLVHQQTHLADRAEILLRGFARVGIIALVDEATGYQEVRDKRALEAILDQFLRKTLAAWAKRFPDEFYWHIFRLKGWEWKGRRVNPPQVVAHYTNDLVYHRLAPNLVEELDRRNPIINGKRLSKNTQWLTDEIGQPALAGHIHAVVGLMRVSKTWNQLKEMIDEAFPRQDATLNLPFFQADFPVEVSATKTSAAIGSLPLFEQLVDRI